MIKFLSPIFHFIIFIVLISFTVTNPGFAQEATEAEMNDEFEKASTIADYEQFIEKYKPHELAFVAVQQLTSPYIKQKDWQGAIDIYKKYKEDFPGLQSKIDKIMEILSFPEKKLTLNNLGSGINSERGEYLPIISADNNKLYYCKRVLKLKTLNDKTTTQENEDIYVSIFNGEQWENGISLGHPISTNNHEAPQSISADGNTISLFGHYPGKLGRGDNFYAEKTALGWSNIKNFPEPINSTYFDADAMLTADGKAVIFISDRPGGVGEFHKKGVFFYGLYWGNTDIYLCTKTDSGWSSTTNLGPVINTPYSEQTPFLHPDGKTLYFSSDGHYGLGGLDVFKTTRLDSSWTNWSEPINLGKEINGPQNDWGYKISTSGKIAYFAAIIDENSHGSYDIYSIELPDEAKPFAVTTINGRVTDSQGNPLSVEIKWNDLSLMKEAGEATSNPQTGEYFIALPAGHKYGYYANKEGYIGKSEHLDLTDKKEYTEYTLDIILYPIEEIKEKEIAIQLNNIFFEFDQWQLKKESFLELNRWVKFLNSNKGLRVEIHGHTDDVGTEAYNLALSQKRAQAVVDYLKDKGVDIKRLLAKGFGEGYPLIDNDTEDGRGKNRRVEIKFAEVAATTR